MTVRRSVLNRPPERPDTERRNLRHGKDRDGCFPEGFHGSRPVSKASGRRPFLGFFDTLVPGKVHGKRVVYILQENVAEFAIQDRRPLYAQVAVYGSRDHHAGKPVVGDAAAQSSREVAADVSPVDPVEWSMDPPSIAFRAIVGYCIAVHGRVNEIHSSAAVARLVVGDEIIRDGPVAAREARAVIGLIANDRIVENVPIAVEHSPALITRRIAGNCVMGNVADTAIQASAEPGGGIAGYGVICDGAEACTGPMPVIAGLTQLCAPAWVPLKRTEKRTANSMIGTIDILRIFLPLFRKPLDSAWPQSSRPSESHKLTHGYNRVGNLEKTLKLSKNTLRSTSRGAERNSNYQQAIEDLTI